jgi:hypothetical protein
MSSSTPDMRLAAAVADRVSRCSYRDLVRLAKFIGVQRAHMVRRGDLEFKVRLVVFGDNNRMERMNGTETTRK